MAESEHGLHSLGVVPAVTDQNAFGVVFIYYILTFAPDAGILLLHEHGAVFHLHGEGEREFAGGIHVAAEHVRKGWACFAAEIPSLNDCGNLVGPRHGDSIPGDVHEHEFLSSFRKGFHQGVLPVRKAVFEAVIAFAVLVLVLVQATEHDDIVGIRSGSDGIGDHLLRGPVFSKVVFGGDAVLRPGGAA